MLDSRLIRDSQMARAPGLAGASPAGVSMLPLAIEGFVGKDYEELVFVLLAMFASFALMVVFGAWWSR